MEILTRYRYLQIDRQFARKIYKELDGQIDGLIGKQEYGTKQKDG